MEKTKERKIFPPFRGTAHKYICIGFVKKIRNKLTLTSKRRPYVQ